MDVPRISVGQMREIDRLAVERFGLEVIQMMENAGRAVAELARQLGCSNPLILCGKGNNGGDGLVAARFLSSWGFPTRVILASSSDDLNPLAKKQFQITNAMGIEVAADLEGADLVIDSLLGYNLRGDPRDNYAKLISLANNSGKQILAVDNPSGLDSETGEAREPCIKATATLALTLPKNGLFLRDGPAKSGKLFVADMGIPHGLYKLLGLEVPRIFKEKNIVKIEK